MPKKNIFIITRYSVLNTNKSGVRLASDSEDIDQYKSLLFSEDRLRARHLIFDKVTVSSLMSVKSCESDVHYLVLTSDVLPAEHRKKLEGSLKRIDGKGVVKTKILEVSSNGSFEYGSGIYKDINSAVDSYIEKCLCDQGDAAFATVRLDDDDAISSSYCAELEKHLRKDLAGYPVSFPYGFQGVYDASSGLFKDLKRFYYPKIALGLSLVNYYTDDSGFFDGRVHVYRLGSHTQIDETNPVIYDSLKPAYFRTIFSFNDSGDMPFHRFLPEVVAGEVDPNEFCFLETYLLSEGKLGAFGGIERKGLNMMSASRYSADHRKNISCLKKELKRNFLLKDERISYLTESIREKDERIKLLKSSIFFRLKAKLRSFLAR